MSEHSLESFWSRTIEGGPGRMLPRVLTGETITRETIADMGHGGLCLDCPECRYPVRPFGR